MNGLGFGRAVLTAAGLSILAAAVLTLGVPLLGAASALHLLLSVLALAYALVVLAHGRRIGRPSLIGGWLLLTALIAVTGLGLTAALLLYLGYLWLVRAVSLAPGALAAVLDAGLIALAIGAALWAGQHSGSLVMAVWCFFLVLAAGALLLPATTRHRTAPADDRFDRARRSADAALRTLAETR